jgi:hypothetical protein
MADPTTTPTDPTAPVMPDVAATQNATAAQEEYNNAVRASNEHLRNLREGLHLSNTAMGFATTAAVGAASGFNQFSRIDMSRVNTFSKQFDELGNILNKNGTILGSSIKDMTLLKNVIGAMGGSTTAGMANALASGTTGLIEYGKQLAMVADQQIKTQESMVQGMAATGDLSALYRKAKYDLSEMNAMSAKVTTSLMLATGATKMDTETLRNWQAQLFTIPGIQKTLIENTARATEKTDLFTKTALFARGAGRDYSTIIQDMTKATYELGMSQDKALEYTGRMTEAAEVMGVPVEELRMAVNSSVDAFQAYASGGENASNVTEGLQESMTEYIKSLKDSGVPMGTAITLGKELAGTLGSMGLAQKSFLSSSTGGPGGMMGAFKIEEMLKKGDIQGVLKKQREAMEKMLGPIVSTEEAASSEASAQKMTKQIMLLRQGPLGQYAKSDAEAEDLLDAMKTGGGLSAIGKGKTALGDVNNNLTLQKAIEQGNKLAQTTDTSVSKIEAMIRQAQLRAGTEVIGKAQELTARAGTRRGAGEGIHPELQSDLRQGEREAGHTSLAAAQTLKDLKGIPASLGTLAGAMVDAIKSGDSKKISTSTRAMDQGLTNWKEAISNMSDADMQKSQQAQMANKAEGLFGTAVQDMSGPTANLSAPQTGGDIFGGGIGQGYTPAGRQVGQAVQSPKGDEDTFGGKGSKAGGATAASTTMQSNQPIPVMLADGSSITVNFTGKCPHCNWNIHSTESARSVSPQSSNG